MKKEAVIFDLDGTLVNSIPSHFKIHQNVCKDLGFKLTYQFFKLYCNGKIEEDFYKDILKHYEGNQKKYQKALQLSKQYHKKMDFSKIKIFSGVKTLLKELKQAGFKIAVASSSPEKYIHIVLGANNCLDYFDAFVGGDDVKKAKPAPDIFLLARKKLSLPKNVCVVIEDANKGLLAAKRASIECICILTSEKKEDVPKYAKPVAKHNQLFNVITQLK